LQLIATVEKLPKKYFELITNSTGFFEIRVAVGSAIFSVFSFFDKENLMILIKRFQKKTQKTPKKEIALVERLEKQYFNEQQSNQ